MDRRRFFSFLPLAPAAAALAVVRGASAQGAPEADVCSLSLHQQPPRARTIPSRSMSFIDTAVTPLEDVRKVDLAIGRDGRLWLRCSDGQWSRVVTEADG
jgi:hypothetical protein